MPILVIDADSFFVDRDVTQFFREISDVSVQTESIAHMDACLNKFSQAGTFLLAGLAFALDQPVITLILMLTLALSALIPAFSPYRLIYRFVLIPLHLLRPRIVEDDPSPHRFAQGIGAAFRKWYLKLCGTRVECVLTIRKPQLGAKVQADVHEGSRVQLAYFIHEW